MIQKLKQYDLIFYDSANDKIERLTEDTVGFSFCPDVTIIEYGKLSAQGRLLVGILGMALMPMGYLLVYTALFTPLCHLLPLRLPFV